MTAPTTSVLADDLGFPEAPRWHAGRLWFSDFHDRVVRRMPAAGGPEVALELDDSPSGLGWLPGVTCWSSPWCGGRCCGWGRTAPGCMPT
ncbi:hypothetical protein ACI799_00655 [Blastococcus sp. SYSU DS0753]